MISRVVLNLKMHKTSGLLDAYAAMNIPCDVLLPFPYLGQAAERFQGTQLRIGAQNVSEFSHGAYTGQVSLEILQDIGVSLVMVGHQEVPDSTKVVMKKVQIAQQAGFDIIYCLGGKSVADLDHQLAGLSSMDGLTFAYEPDGSIGTQQSASIESINESVDYIRARIRQHFSSNVQDIPVLYGGSVNNKNCQDILGNTSVDGVLIGGASLNLPVLEEVLNICKRF